MYRNVGYGALASFLKAIAFLVIFTSLRRSDVCIAVSNSTAEALVRNGVSEDRIYVNGNGVDLDYIDAFQFKGEKIYEGVFVGRISREKGIFDLVASWKEIVDRKKDARLVIIGSGPDIERLRSMVVEFDLKRNIVVKGALSDREMYTLVKASKVFVFPSMFEGWGLAVAEALACGLPVVAYDIPALREVFGDCPSVFLVPPRDLDTLAATVLEVLVKETEGASEDSKRYVERFDWRNVAMRDLQIIHPYHSHKVNSRALPT